MIIKNARIILQDNQTVIKDIWIEEGLIQAIEDKIEKEDEILDAHGMLVMSGGIDVHVHLREPGYTQKETIHTGTLAAAHGGYTTVMAMPNVVPSPDNVTTMKEYLALIEKEAVVKVVPYGCITKNEKGKELVDFEALKQYGITAFSDDGVGVQEDAVMEEAMKQAAQADVLLAAHTEDMRYRRPNSCIHEGIRSAQFNLVGIPSECEYKQIERDLKLAEKYHACYHICHMSAKESVALLREYKNKGADVSGEVTAHHLLLNEMDVENENHKMNPPLRSAEDQKALIEGLKDGTIEILANDHAPHTIEDKSKGMAQSAFGIVSLETSIPLVYTELVKTGILTLEQFQNIISANPAKRFGFHDRGKIAVGYEADLFALEQKTSVIDKNAFVSKGKNTPFDGRKVEGVIAWTMVHGKIVMERRSNG